MKKLIFLFFLFVCNETFTQSNLAFDTIRLSDSILQSYTNPKEPGLAVAVIENGKVIYQNSKGMADLSNNIRITDSSTFNIASVSKQFTALLALIAEEEGKLSLQDSISRYLPELENLPYEITIEQLTNHTHGLPNYSDLIDMIGYNIGDPLSNNFAVETMLNVETVNFKPGTQYQYGNSGYILLAEILKRVYKKDFSILINEKIFEPLNMTQSNVIDNPNTIIENKAISYTTESGNYIEYSNRQMESGSSNIYTSLNDMIKWTINFQNPKVGSSIQMNKLWVQTVSFSKDSDLGYGMGLISETYKGLETVFHGGGTAGYRAYILHVPKHNLSIVTLGNQNGFDGLLIVQDLLRNYLGEYFTEPELYNVSYSPEELKEFEGTYEIHPGQYWTIRSDDENLYFGGNTEPLPLVGQRKFEFIYLPTAYLTFDSNYMYFRIADFNYPCKKVRLNQPVLDLKELQKYIGVYKNESFNVFYELSIIENKLVATQTSNGQIVLSPLSRMTFFADAPLGVLNFQTNQEGEVNGFILDGQNFKNIEFKKVN